MSDVWHRLGWYRVPRGDTDAEIERNLRASMTNIAIAVVCVSATIAIDVVRLLL
jgi:hypothetical protein